MSAEPVPAKWWKPYVPWLVRLALVLVGALATWLGVSPQIVEVIKEIPVAQAPPAVPEGVQAFGWVEDRDEIERNLDPAKTLHFSQTPAGRAALAGDEDVFLYRLVRKAGKFAGAAYPNVNQESVGCCVGCGSKHGVDVCQAAAIATGKPFEWKPASVEVIYAGSRIDVGRGQIRGDGSVGRWAMEYLRGGGLAPMERIGAVDLSAFSPARARAWGQSGAPAEVRAVAKLHPARGAALVTSAADVKRALLQLYPVVVCSDVGFNNRDGSVGTRDKDGFCVPRGVWPHCMCFVAWRGGPRPGALCLNSWGDRAHGGPVWPPDMPVAAFWVDEATVDRMVRQGDSFALSDLQGFPKRVVPLIWDVRAAPRPAPKRAPLDLFALAP